MAESIGLVDVVEIESCHAAVSRSGAYRHFAQFSRQSDHGNLMKKCTWCGAECSDEEEVCVFDQQLLSPVGGASQKESLVESSEPSLSAASLLECAVGATQIATGHFGGIVHVVKGLLDLDSPAEENSPHSLMERAAALESVDMRQAIVIYKLIALNHPGTAAAEEASRNVRTLCAAHPYLLEFV